MISGVLTMTVFSERLIAERLQAFWAVLQRGEFITDAAADAGTYRKKGARWLAAAGGVRAVLAGTDESASGLKQPRLVRVCPDARRTSWRKGLLPLKPFQGSAWINHHWVTLPTLSWR
jgi:hypothetical protein